MVDMHHTQNQLDKKKTEFLKKLARTLDFKIQK